MEIHTSIICLLQLLAAIVCMVRCEDEEEVNDKKLCQGMRHVCTTLMKYPDGYVANEGPYCSCLSGNCGAAWSENDGQSLTWKHYERVHWKVQYRFCSPIPEYEDLRECDKGERAAVIKTEVAAWEPFLPPLRCRCRDDTHHMTGWKKEGGVWNYFYHCDTRECKDDGVCARILVDTNKKSDIVKEVIFNCACPHGYLCPAKIQDESKVEVDEVVIKCSAVKQSNNKKD